MKNLVYIMMGLMGIFVFASCDKDSEYDESAMFKVKPETKPNPTPTPTPTDTTKKDTIPTWKGDWGTPVKNNLIPIGEPTATSHMWHGVQVFYNENNDSLVRTAQMPFGYEMTPSTGFSTAKTKEDAVYTGSNSYSSNSTTKSYGEWFKDAEGNMLRKVTNIFSFPTSEFNKTLTVTHFEGYSTVNGREHSFKSPSISASFKSLTVTDSKEVTRNDSIFMQKTYVLTAVAKFHISSQNVRAYEVSATHTVESFLRLKEKESEEKMPAADIYVSKLIKATDIVAFPVWVSNDKIQGWSKGSLVEDETHYHMWVDGRFVGSYAKSKLTGTNYNAVMLDGKDYVPCLCKPDGKEGFYYSVEYADGSYKIQTVDERLAVSSGLKNFTKDDRANQTPFVKTTRETKNYNGKSWLKLTGYNVDGKPTLSYTVAEK